MIFPCNWPLRSLSVPRGCSVKAFSPWLPQLIWSSAHFLSWKCTQRHTPCHSPFLTKLSEQHLESKWKSAVKLALPHPNYTRKQAREIPNIFLFLLIISAFRYFNIDQRVCLQGKMCSLEFKPCSKASKRFSLCNIQVFIALFLFQSSLEIPIVCLQQGNI